MGFMDWIMKGVDAPEVQEPTKKVFDDKTIENLKNISNSEMQESTTLTSMPVQNQNSYNYQNQQMYNNMQSPMSNPMQANMQFGAGMQEAYNQYNNQPYYNGMPMQQIPVGMPMYTTQNVYMQTAPNQPFAPTTITIFQVSSEEDIKYALKHLGKKSPCVISFNKMNKKKLNGLCQFLNGGVFALGATMMKWHNDDYLLTPRGMAISRQDKSKR
ncbi:MAG: cell division protein SepF [Clostridia bacterium]|nr:cell division protein SepF [Clostridia bacterium]